MGLNGNQAFWQAESRGIELINITIGDLFDQRCQTYADKEALVYNYPEIDLNLRLTYREYHQQVTSLAKALLALGIENGEHVAVWATNVPEWVLLQYGAALAGA